MKGPIVVPLDGSRLAERALPFALAVARNSGSPLHLVTVHEPVPALTGDGFDASYDPRWHATTRPGQQEYLHEVAARLDTEGVAIETSVMDGAVVPTLKSYMERTEPAMLVMATHGQGGLERVALGSTLDRMIRQAAVPVLVIRSSSRVDREPRMKRILIALDGSPFAEQVLDPVLGLGTHFGSHYELVQAVPRPFEIESPFRIHSVRVDEESLGRGMREAESYLARVRWRLEANGADMVTTRVLDVPGQGVADALLKAAADGNADLIALATHGRGGWRRAVLGSVADTLIRMADRPVLVVRPCLPHGGAA